MSSMGKIIFKVPVEVEVDVEDWCTAYGMTESLARHDAPQHVQAMVAEVVNELFTKVANGSRLIGKLAQELPS
jgi:hypothetical protein